MQPDRTPSAAYPASQKCGLWGCGKSATTPVTIIHPEAGAKEIVVCDYHSMMVHDAR